MPDEEKVAKAIEYLDWYFTQDDGTSDKDAVKAWEELIKEREPVRPETIVQTGIGEGPTIHALVCGNCHKIINYNIMYNFRFCPWCGRKVKRNA